MHGKRDERRTAHFGGLFFGDELLQRLHGFATADETQRGESLRAQGAVYFIACKPGERGNEFAQLPFTGEADAGQLHGVVR